VTEESAVATRMIAPPPRGVERILLVDDEELIASITQQILRNLGYSVRAFTDSADTLDEFRSHPHEYDLVVTDLTMPKLTGAELVRELMRIRPDLPIVLMSGSGEAVTAETVRALGIRALLMKPFSTTDLGHTIRNALDGRTN
jgi:CheY-like chemotaxis protein